MPLHKSRCDTCTDLIRFGGQSEATIDNRSDRWCDSLARVMAHELDHKCVAVSFFRKALYVASNDKVFKVKDVREFLWRLKERRDPLNQLEKQRLKSLAEKKQRKALDSNSPDGNEYEILRGLRIKRDVYKLRRFWNELDSMLNESDSIAVLEIDVGSPVEAKTNVHAELKILQRIHARLDPNEKARIYMGVSLLCCPKCHKVLSDYKEMHKHHLQLEWRGYHASYEGNWEFPENLGLSYAIKYQNLKNATSMKRDEMVAQESDSDGEDEA